MRERRQSTDDTLSILVGDLYKRGAPRSEAPVVRRRLEGRDDVAIELTPYQNEVLYTYRRVSPQHGVEELQRRLRVTWEPANLGGMRAWLHCSSPGCSRRTGRLFLSDESLVCQLCAGLMYPSHAKPVPPHVKKLRRANKIRVRLGGQTVFGDPLPPRPKGMHQLTYEKLCVELEELDRAEEERINEAIGTGELSLLDELAKILERQPPTA